MRSTLRVFPLLLLVLSLPLSARAQAGRIYTKPDPSATGAISGRIATALSHAMAVAHDRTRVYLANLSDGGQTFRFDHLPPAKYDLVLVAKTGVIYEGLALGTPPKPDALPEHSLQNMEKRIAVSDSFFNRQEIHRRGLSEDGDTMLAFVERYRAEGVLKQSGEALGQMVRRLEIAELTRATDDWQLSSTRHIYREGEPAKSPHFFSSINLPMLEGIRVVDAPKELGEIPMNPPN